METDDTIAEAANAATSVTDTQLLIVFKLGLEEYGISIDQIREVVLTPRITRMPQTPSYIEGVANVRGSILAIVNLEKKLEIESAQPATQDLAAQYTLVVESEEQRFGILVKEVPNTLAVNSSDIQEPTNVIQTTSQKSHYITGIVRMNERLIILIDLHEIMQNEKSVKS
ncbi:MAG: chemotaxis protein CheW [Tunicatimonas sp.]